MKNKRPKRPRRNLLSLRKENVPDVVFVSTKSTIWTKSVQTVATRFARVVLFIIQKVMSEPFLLFELTSQNTSLRLGTCNCPNANFGRPYCHMEPRWYHGHNGRSYTGDRHPEDQYPEEVYEPEPRPCGNCGEVTRLFKEEFCDASIW